MKLITVRLPVALATAVGMLAASAVFGQSFTPIEPANQPMGVAVGANPGRVAWAFDPRATTWDGTTNAPGWWANGNTHPEVVAQMFSAVIRSVGGAPDEKAAWERLFRNVNERRGRGAIGYRAGEKVAIKLNLNQSRSHGENGNASYIAPQLVRAIVAQLVRNVGVAPADITCFDASRYVPSTIYDLGREFPGLQFVDNVGGDGRARAKVDTSHPLYLGSSPTPLYFPTCVTEASYLINVAGLKGHTMAGMTVCAKNHLGTVLNEDGSYAARRLHEFIAVRGARSAAQQMGEYNGLVDLNGHEQIGGKTLLYVVDALYATRHNECRLDNSCRWQSAPFAGNWTASVLASQDGVAIDSVALDFLRSEPTLRSIVTGAVDNYLHEEAMAGSASAPRAYDPERNGTTLKSLGVHEHWNDAGHKQYSRNLGRAGGIELVQVGAPAS